MNYQRDIEKDAAEETAGSEGLRESFTTFVATLQFETKGYAIAYLRNEFNEKYLSSDIHISNRRMKSLLIEHFGDSIYFTYSKDPSVSQMVFSNKITVAQLAEEIRNSDCIKECAETLRSDIKSYDFGLENTDCDAKDLFKSFTEAKNKVPKSWLKFCSAIFPSYQTTSRYIPLHSFEGRVPLTVLTALPAIHSLTGCDTTSKVSTKLAALKAAESCAEDLLLEFGKGPLNEDMEKKAEEFLVRALASRLGTMDKLRFHQFHHKKLRNFQDLAPTSRSTRLHIKRSYLQCYKWIHALEPSEKLNPLDYGYIEEDGTLIPQVTDDPTDPEDFPMPCNCQMCFRGTVCPCRRLKIMCCDFCKCKSSVLDQCKNPHT